MFASTSTSSSASPDIALVDALWPLTALFGGWAAATALLHACTAATDRARRRLEAAEDAGSTDRPPPPPAPNAKTFCAPGGPWCASLSLFGFGVAGGAALPLSALLRWLLLAAAAAAWLLYGLPRGAGEGDTVGGGGRGRGGGAGAAAVGGGGGGGGGGGTTRRRAASVGGASGITRKLAEFP